MLAVTTAEWTAQLQRVLATTCSAWGFEGHGPTTSTALHAPYFAISY